MSGSGGKVMFADTVLRGILGYGDRARPPAFLAGIARVADVFDCLTPEYENLSYIQDWRKAFSKSPQLDLEVCNINNLIHYGRCISRIKNYDLIIVSHAAAGDNPTILLKTAALLARRRGILAMFIGNEYDLLEEKLTFARQVGANYICSQLPVEAATVLYGDSGAQLISMPHALNPEVYYPIENRPRALDIGFVGDKYLPFIGDEERAALIEFFEANCSNLV
jgi:hypothetical protein